MKPKRTLKILSFFILIVFCGVEVGYAERQLVQTQNLAPSIQEIELSEIEITWTDSIIGTPAEDSIKPIADLEDILTLVFPFEDLSKLIYTLVHVQESENAPGETSYKFRVRLPKKVFWVENNQLFIETYSSEVGNTVRFKVKTNNDAFEENVTIFGTHLHAPSGFGDTLQIGNMDTVGIYKLFRRLFELPDADAKVKIHDIRQKRRQWFQNFEVTAKKKGYRYILAANLLSQSIKSGFFEKAGFTIIDLREISLNDPREIEKLGIPKTWIPYLKVLKARKEVEAQGILNKRGEKSEEWIQLKLQSIFSIAFKKLEAGGSSPNSRKEFTDGLSSLTPDKDYSFLDLDYDLFDAAKPLATTWKRERRLYIKRLEALLESIPYKLTTEKLYLHSRTGEMVEVDWLKEGIKDMLKNAFDAVLEAHLFGKETSKPTTGKVTIRFTLFRENDKDFLKIIVRDNGIGVSQAVSERKEEYPRLFMGKNKVGIPNLQKSSEFFGGFFKLEDSQEEGFTTDAIFVVALNEIKADPEKPEKRNAFSGDIPFKPFYRSA